MGWLISVERQNLEKDESELVLASWYASWGGLKWIKDLVKQGEATVLSDIGYSNRYTALAKDILPFIENELSKGKSMERSIIINPERIKDCLPDEELLVDACDMS